MTSIVARVDYQKVLKKSEEMFKRTALPRTAPIDVEKASKSLGITILRKELEGDVSGFLFMDHSHEPIIGLNSRHSATRQRFTIAHELGHFFLHAPKSGDASFIDKNFFIVNRDDISSKGIAFEEIEANFFAAEVLMPAENIYIDFVRTFNPNTASEIHKTLAEKYDVSNEAMRFRLNNLGFIRF